MAVFPRVPFAALRPGTGYCCRDMTENLRPNLAALFQGLATYMSGSLSFTGFQRAVCGVPALRLADPRPALIRAPQKGMSSITSPLSEIRRHVPVSIPCKLPSATKHVAPVD